MRVAPTTATTREGRPVRYRWKPLSGDHPATARRRATAIVSPTTGSVCGAVCWKGGGSGTLEHISDKKRGTDKVKLSFSTFRLDGEQSPDLSPKLSRLLLDDKASSETALAKTAFAYAVTWPSRARDSVGLTNYKNKRKRQPVDSADAHNMYEFFHC